MMGFSYRVYCLGSSLRSRLARRLTPAGWAALSGLCVTGALGVELDQSVASQTFAVLLCLLAVAILWTPLFRARFEVKRILPRFGSVGQPFSYRVSVRTSRAKSWHGLELFEDLADPRLSREEFIEAHRLRAGDRSFRLAGARPGAIPYRRAVFKPLRLPTIPPQGKAAASLELLPLKRGPLRFRGVTLARRDPLDLFRAFYRV